MKRTVVSLLILWLGAAAVARADGDVVLSGPTPAPIELPEGFRTHDLVPLDRARLALLGAVPNTTGSLLVVLQAGAGGLAELTRAKVPPTVDLVAADLDGDGDRELVVGTQDGALYAYALEAAALEPVGRVGQGELVWRAGSGDVTGAGRDAVVLVGSTIRLVRADLEQPGRLLEPEVWSRAPEQLRLRAPFGLLVGDLDDAPGSELLVGADDGGGASFVLLRHSADGAKVEHVQRLPVTAPRGAHGGPTCLTWHDVDGDGTAEVVAALPGGDVGGFRLQTSAAGMSFELLWSARLSEVGARRLALGDVDGDGRPDLAAVCGTPSRGGELVIARQTAPGRFERWRSSGELDSLVDGGGVAMIDVTGDDRPEVVLAGAGVSTYQARERD